MANFVYRLNKFLDNKILDLTDRIKGRQTEPPQGPLQERWLPTNRAKEGISRPRLKAGRALSLMLTEKCNLRCAYCLRDTGDEGKEIPFPVLKRIILSAYRYGIREFSITGGETLVYPHWRELIELIGSLKSSVFIETNGYDLKEEDVIFLKNTLSNQSIKFLVSLDSYQPDIHDKFRGKGTFAKAVEAIKLLHRYGIPVEVNTLITPLNFMNEEDILNYLKFNKTLGAGEVVLGEAVGLGRAAESPFLLNDNQRRQIGRILTKHHYFRDAGIRVRLGLFLENTNLEPCARLGSEISVSPYGLHPCVFQVETVKLGDFKDFEKLLHSDFLNSLYWAGAAMQECYKKGGFFSCSKCIKYLPEWLSHVKNDTSLNPKQDEKD